MKNYQVLSGLMGVCIGDALGVPVEFSSRNERTMNPVTKMIGYGAHNQPPGTWSDDSSMTLCLAECLCNGFDLEAIAHSFYRWRYEDYWTPWGKVFDIGGTTAAAISRIKKGVAAVEAGGRDDRNNGNGSLMRILPLVYTYKNLNFSELIQQVHDCSCITHGHLRSQMACGIYISIAICLLEGLELKTAYLQGIENIQQIYSQEKYAGELHRFQKVLNGEIKNIPITRIHASGYVLDTLEASLWCLLNTNSFAEAVLKAVNLGEDTDTTGAVTGGLAGIYYGIENIPNEWIEVIARKDDIVNLASRLATSISD
ncbi:ADP-ribosylglycohydrolase family protein [Okeania sp. SIO3I5]|uniref:ADP-ribosylglycohydrolase family protein n=1 Tax=Okeania sp. SIO3I5 TaxID=2607805 RepID=UPI0025E6B087|nr:ADP-ribosylglycohydrolase family protein [Okeania sp. SIO3I5]